MINKNRNKKGRLFTNNPLRLDERIPVKDICPSCHSIYITKDHCEACGLQFGVDLIGKPFGAKSFFTLKDDFDLSLSKLDFIQWSLAPEIFLRRAEVKRYIRHMLKRFNDLSSYLFSLQLNQASESNLENKFNNKFNNKDENIRLFTFELKELMKEYKKFSNDLSAFFVLLKKNGLTEGQRNPIGNFLVSYMYELNAEKKLSETTQSSSEGITSYWKMLKSGMLLEAFAAIIAVTLASFFVFKFLAT